MSCGRLMIMHSAAKRKSLEKVTCEALGSDGGGCDGWPCCNGLVGSTN